jgi:hypothetical protein
MSAKATNAHNRKMREFAKMEDKLKAAFLIEETADELSK